MIAKLVATGVNDRFYNLSDYKEFFRQLAAGANQTVNISSGSK